MKFILNKSLSLFLSLVLIVFTTMTIHVEDASAGESPLLQSCNTATLTDCDGNMFLLPITPVYSYQSNTIMSAENDILFTYKCEIPADIMATGGSQTEYDNDGTYASTVYLTIHYSHNTESPVEYVLKKITGHWNVTAQNVSVSSATLDYACGALNFEKNVAVYNYPVSNNFTKQTGYSKYVPTITGAAIGATLNLKYSMGSTRTWSFKLQNNICPR